MRRLILIVCLSLGLSNFGCVGETNAPPKIRYGQEACSECKMVIAEERFAASLTDQGGSVFKFDDIGCLLTFMKKQNVLPESAWVHDESSGSWMDARGAFYAFSSEISPMGYGILAFRSMAEARESSTTPPAKVMPFDELRKNFQPKGGEAT